MLTKTKSNLSENKRLPSVFELFISFVCNELRQNKSNNFKNAPNNIKKKIDKTINTLYKMTEKKIRHILLMEDSKLLGIVSIGDVVNHLINKIKEENKSLREYINSY